MIDGFLKTDSGTFYGQIWPAIHQHVDALQSNWTEVRAALRAGLNPPPLLIHWGYKTATGDKIIIAASQSIPGQPDEHWYLPSAVATRQT